MDELLFQMYYVEGGHLNSIPDLVKAALDLLELDGVGDDAAAVITKYLESDEDKQAVDSLAAKYKPMASGVPTFLLSRQEAGQGERPLIMSGARPPGAFIDVFHKLVAADG